MPELVVHEAQVENQLLKTKASFTERSLHNQWMAIISQAEKIKVVIQNSQEQTSFQAGMVAHAYSPSGI